MLDFVNRMDDKNVGNSTLSWWLFHGRGGEKEHSTSARELVRLAIFRTFGWCSKRANFGATAKKGSVKTWGDFHKSAFEHISQVKLLFS